MRKQPKGRTATQVGILIAGFAICIATVVAAAPYEGYNLFAALNSTQTSLMDNDGNVVHSWNTTYTPGNSVYLLESGRLLHTGNVHNTDFDTDAGGGIVQTINWDGTVEWAYTCSSAAQLQHHDVEMLPNGNVLMIVWEVKTEAEALAAGRNAGLLSDGELWPDSIIEVQPSGSTSGEIVWEWHIWDHLVQDHDATKDNYGVVADHPERIDLNYARHGGADWTHINSIDYNAELDQILLSVHGFSEIWIIDHSTTTEEAAGHSEGESGKGGDLLYRWGNPQTYGAETSDDQKLFLQHDAEWIGNGLSGEGNILVFNNGQGRPEGNYSSIEEITPPLTASGYTLSPGSAYGPESSAWSYVADTPTEFYAERISGAQRLPNGNTLICNGPNGVFFEVTEDRETVWQYTTTGHVFRVERYGRDYAGFDGTPLDDDTGELSYPIVDTNQGGCYDNAAEIAAPSSGAAFYGQDAQYVRNPPSYTVSQDDLTVTDNNTGLVWTKSPDLDEDGDIDANDKLTQSEAEVYADALNSIAYGGRTDWRVPSIKELYSLIDFNGTDPMPTGSSTAGLVPFIDTDYFDFAYGDMDAGERVIDAQYVSTTNYVGTVFNGQAATFGVNFADGRIKGYPSTKTFFCRFVAGNTSYGQNAFSDNGDGTVTDSATGLMWSQSDSGSTMMNWEDALAWVQARNAENYLGHDDWRLPNAKELQSILDYTRSPDTTGSPAIDAVFNATQITNEAGQTDYPFYWTSTSFLRFDGSASAAVYVSFGRGLGSMDSVNVIDVHGAGCQRSDPKNGDPDDYPSWGFGPQGDVQRVFNCVRLVRENEGSLDPPEADPAFSDAQTLAISTDRHIFAGALRYGDSQWSATVDTSVDSEISYTLEKGAWIGLFLYDYQESNWTESAYVYRAE